jgi:MoaA/NifB/PqqE/SkfB family radical SAM enzyme
MSRLPAEPREAVIAVTLGCNSRCKTCDIWMIRPEGEMQPEDYRRLPRSLRHLNVSGGEPFLRDDLPDIIRVMHEVTPSARVVFSTNGILPDRIVGGMREIRKIVPEAAVRISIDGIGEAHDETRGVPGNYDKCLETMEKLRGIGVKDLGVSATASQHNPGEVARVQELALELGVEFVVGVAHSSPTYFGDQVQSSANPESTARELTQIRDRELGSWSVKKWFRAYFTDGLIDQLEGRPRRMPCYAIETHFYLDPHGNVYPCNAREEQLGNLLEHTYEELVERNQELLEDVRRCHDCWMSCTVSPGLRQHPWKAALWVAAAKLKGAPDRLPLRPAEGTLPGRGQGQIPIYLDEKGRERYDSVKGVGNVAPATGDEASAT